MTDKVPCSPSESLDIKRLSRSTAPALFRYVEALYEYLTMHGWRWGGIEANATSTLYTVEVNTNLKDVSVALEFLSSDQTQFAVIHAYTVGADYNWTTDEFKKPRLVLILRGVNT